MNIEQQFANDDLFDAELGEDSDGGQNGDHTDDENASNSPAHDWLDKENEERLNSNEEAANSGSDEETLAEKKKKQRKRESKKVRASFHVYTCLRRTVECYATICCMFDKTPVEKLHRSDENIVWLQKYSLSNRWKF